MQGNEPRLNVRDVMLLGAAIVSRLEGPAALEHERVVSVDREGNIVRIVDGHARHAVIGYAFDDELRVPGADLTVVHNHPSGTSFSGDDLVLLNRPGVARVQVLGHDGSVYEASVGPRFDARRFASETFPRAKAALMAKAHLLAKRPAFTVHVAHLIALVLHEAKVIIYRVEMGPERSRSEFSHRLAFKVAAQMASEMVRQDLDRSEKVARVGPPNRR